MTKEETKIIEQSFKQKPEEAERLFRSLYLERRLQEHDNNITRTAHSLGWTRAGLQKAIKRLANAPE